jgi:hypothetical protein
MQRISEIEPGLKRPGQNQLQLFSSITSESPIDAQGHISILSSDRPGCTAEDPMACVDSESQFTQRIKVTRIPDMGQL